MSAAMSAAELSVTPFSAVIGSCCVLYQAALMQYFDVPSVMRETLRIPVEDFDDRVKRRLVGCPRQVQIASEASSRGLFAAGADCDPAPEERCVHLRCAMSFGASACFVVQLIRLRRT